MPHEFICKQVPTAPDHSMRKEWRLPEHGFDVETLTVDAKRREHIASLKQGTSEWLEARYGRLTASRFGAVAGHHTTTAKNDVLRGMLWPELDELVGRAKDFAAYGSRNEALARSVYESDRRSRGSAVVDLYETGLLVSVEHGWLGSSPDFVIEERSRLHERPVGIIRNEHHARAPYIIVHASGAQTFIDDCSRKMVASEDTTSTSLETVVGCGEIKCPATLKLYSRNAKHAKYAFPEYYYDQIQGVMAINGWPWCDTVVYTPLETEVIRFYANAEYWSKTLFPALRSFYFDEFLPRLQLRCQGKLPRGAVDPVMVIPKCIDELGIDMTLTKAKKQKRK